MKEGGSGAVTVAATAGDHRTASTTKSTATASRSATKSTAGDHRAAGSPRAAVPADDTNFEYDDNNEWDVGIGDLIIDLDNDIEKNGGAGGSRQAAATGAGGAGMGARTRDTAASSSSSSSSPSFDKGLKMKIKRTCKAGGNATDAKHEIVSSSESSSSSTSSSCSVTMTTSCAGNGADDPVLAASQSADDRTPVSAGSAAARRSTTTPGRKDKRAREPVVLVKTEQSENGETTSTVDAAHHGANSDDSTSDAKRLRRTSDSIEDALEVCVGTDDMISRGTSMDPDCLGPCEPGTSVNLQGIVWQETACGVLVVNITWRGKTYVGTLLDCTRQQEWAPPRFNDSPTADLDPRAAKARAKRGRGADMAGGMAETRSGKLRGGGGAQAKGRRTTANSGAAAAFTAPPSPARRKGRGAGGTTAVDSPLSSSELQQRTPGKLARGGSLEPADSADGCDQPGLLIECPEPNCSKKYRHANGLRYHQSHAHQNGPTASPVSVSVSSTAQDGEVKVKIEQPATSPGVTAATPAASAPSPLPDLKKPLKMEDVGMEDVEVKPTPSRIPAVPVVSSIGLTSSRPASPAAAQKRGVQDAGVAGPALRVMVHQQPTAAASQDSPAIVGGFSTNQRQSPLVASVGSPLVAAPAGVGRVGCPVPADADTSASAVESAVGATTGESIESTSLQPAVVGSPRAMVAASHQPPVSPSLAAADLQHRTASPAYSDISDDSQPSSSDHVGVGPVVTSAVPPTGLVKPQPMTQRPTPPPAAAAPSGVFYHHHPFFQPTAEPAAASAVVTSPHWRKQQSVAPPAVRPANAVDRSPSSGAGRVGSPAGADYGTAGRVPFYTYPYHLAAAAGYPTAAGGPPPSVPPQPPVSAIPPMPPQPGGAFALSGLLAPSRYKPPAATPPREQHAGRAAGLAGSPVGSSAGGRVTLPSSTGTTAAGGASPLSRPPAAAGRVNSPTTSRDSDTSRRATPFAAYPSPYGLGPAAAMPPYPSMLLGAPAFHHAAAAANVHHPRFPGLPEDLSRLVAASGYPSVEALAASGFYPRPPPPPPAPTAALGSSRVGGKETALLEAQRAGGRAALADPQRTYQPVQPAPPNPQPYAGVPVSVPSATFAPIK